MTRGAKIVYALAVLSGLMLGCALGYYRQSERFALLTSVLEMPVSDKPLDDYAYLQYKHADSAHAKEALLMQVSFLERLERNRRERYLESSLGTSYVRLAILAETEHDPDQARDYMHKAKYWFALRGSTYPSDAEAKAAVQRIDELVHR